MRSDVVKIFDAFVNRIYGTKGQDVVRFFVKHERKDIFIDNMCAQIKGVERSKMSLRFDKEKYTRSIEECAALFCRNALLEAKQNALTDIARARMQEEAASFARMEEEQKSLAKEFASQ